MKSVENDRLCFLFVFTDKQQQTDPEPPVMFWSRVSSQPNLFRNQCFYLDLQVPVQPVLLSPETSLTRLTRTRPEQ